MQLLYDVSDLLTSAYKHVKDSLFIIYHTHIVNFAIHAIMNLFKLLKTRAKLLKTRAKMNHR